MAEDYPQQLASQLALDMQQADPFENIWAAGDSEQAEADPPESKDDFVHKNMQLQKEVGAR